MVECFRLKYERNANCFNQSEKYIEHTPTVDVFYDASQSWHLTRLGKKPQLEACMCLLGV